MVKFYSTEYSYDYGFSAVSLAYFLRYPNPYSRHVTSTDTISRSFDPVTQKLTTVRLHLKRSRLPPAVVKLLPRGTLGISENGNTQSFILEESVVDVKEGWMETESRNLDWNNILSVIERHTYRRPPLAKISDTQTPDLASRGALALSPGEDRTDVSVSVMLKSRIGEQIRKRRQRWGQQASATSVMGGPGETGTIDEEQPAKGGWFNSWTSGAARSAIETISLQRTERSQPKAQKGMSVVLARLRTGGLEAVLEGMKADKELA